METTSLVGGFIPADLWKRTFCEGNSDPVFARGSMLVSSAFFAGRAGGLRELEAAFLHHKIECIRDLNVWMSEPKIRFQDCLKLIGALSLTEAYLGNEETSLAHMTGLMMLLNVKAEAQEPVEEAFIDPEKEDNAVLIERYDLLSQCLHTYLTARGKGDRSPRANSPASLISSLTSNIGSLVPFSISGSRHESILETIRLIPYYFSRPQLEGSQQICAMPILNELRYLTDLLAEPASGELHGPENIAVLVLTAGQLHSQTLFAVQQDSMRSGTPDSPYCTWKSLQAARFCYLYGVLGLKRAEGPPARSLLPHLLVILNDGAPAKSSIGHDDVNNHDLWIWKLCSARSAIGRHRAALYELHGQQKIEDLEQTVSTTMAWWRGEDEITSWSGTVDALKRMVWPEVTNLCCDIVE